MPEFISTPEENSEMENLSAEEKELLEIRALTSSDDGEYEIVSPQETDSLASESWKKYLNRANLLEAWSPPKESPYLKYVKTKTISSIEFVGHKLKPRYSPGEKKSENELFNLIKILDKNTAVILDSGGAHSVAMAVRLVKQGYQPVVMFDSIPHSHGLNKTEQGLATLLYFAEELHKLKQGNQIKSEAPPVFILDCHRDNPDVSRGRDKTIVDNTNSYNESDFPSAEKFQKYGITKIVYLDEEDDRGMVNSDFQSLERLQTDLRPVGQKLAEGGINIIYTGVAPWKNMTLSYAESIETNPDYI